MNKFLRSFTLLAFAASIAGNIAAMGTIYHGFSDGDDDLSAGLSEEDIAAIRLALGLAPTADGASGCSADPDLTNIAAANAPHHEELTNEANPIHPDGKPSAHHKATRKNSCDRRTGAESSSKPYSCELVREGVTCGFSTYSAEDMVAHVWHHIEKTKEFPPAAKPGGRHHRARTKQTS